MEPFFSARAVFMVAPLGSEHPWLPASGVARAVLKVSADPHVVKRSALPFLMTE